MKKIILSLILGTLLISCGVTKKYSEKYYKKVGKSVKRIITKTSDNSAIYKNNIIRQKKIFFKKPNDNQAFFEGNGIFRNSWQRLYIKFNNDDYPYYSTERTRLWFYRGIIKDYLVYQFKKNNPRAKVLKTYLTGVPGYVQIDYVPEKNLSTFNKKIKKEEKIKAENRRRKKIMYNVSKLEFNNSSNYFISNSKKIIYTKKKLIEYKKIPEDITFWTNFNNGIALTNKGFINSEFKIIYKNKYDITNMDKVQIKHLANKFSEIVKKFTGKKVMYLTTGTKKYTHPFTNLDTGEKRQDSKNMIDATILKFELALNKYYSSIIIVDNNIKSKEITGDSWVTNQKRTIINGYGDTGERWYSHMYRYKLKLSNTTKINQFINQIVTQNITLDNSKYTKSDYKKIEDIDMSDTKTKSIKYQDYHYVSKEEMARRICERCKIDDSKTTSPKTTKNWFGITEEKPGKIVMKNYSEYKFYYDDGGFFLDGGIIFGKTRFESYEDMVNYFLSACKEQYCK